MTTRKEQFPRTSELPSQSPQFWVEQKDRYLRQILIKDIQEITQRTLLVYFANRFEPGSDIDLRDGNLLAEVFADASGGPVDLLLETNGGSTDATEGLISYIRNVAQDFRVIVAKGAKSNGTLIAMLGRSIVMGPSSELGPIEPSVQNIPCSILIQPNIATSNFPLHMYGTYALQQTRALATRLLKEGMLKGKSDAEIDVVVQSMSSRDKYASHGSAIDYNEALALGLNIEKLGVDDELWKRIWLLYCMYAHDCRKAKYLKIFEGPFKSTAISVQAP